MACGGTDPVRDQVSFRFDDQRLQSCRLSREQRFTTTSGGSILCLGGWKVQFSGEGDRISYCRQ